MIFAYQPMYVMNGLLKPCTKTIYRQPEGIKIETNLDSKHHDVVYKEDIISLLHQPEKLFLFQDKVYYVANFYKVILPPNYPILVYGRLYNESY